MRTGAPPPPRPTWATIPRTWEELIIIPPAEDTKTESWLEYLGPYGALATARHKRRHVTRIHILFKDPVLRDQVAASLKTIRPDVQIKEPFEAYTATIDHTTRTQDLHYIDQVWDHAHSLEERDALLAACPPVATAKNYKQIWFQYGTRHTLVSGTSSLVPSAAARRRPMDLVCFSSQFFSRRLEQARERNEISSDVEWIELRRLEMLLLAHDARIWKGCFRAEMFPTTGILDGVLRRIAHWVVDEAPIPRHAIATVTTVAAGVSEETFGAGRMTPTFNIHLELNLPAPRWPKA